MSNRQLATLVVCIIVCTASLCLSAHNSAKLGANNRSESNEQMMKYRDFSSQFSTEDEHWFKHTIEVNVIPTSRWIPTILVGGKTAYYCYVEIAGLKALMSDAGTITFLPGQENVPWSIDRK